jgi:hypothetical protein
VFDGKIFGRYGYFGCKILFTLDVVETFYHGCIHVREIFASRIKRCVGRGSFNHDCVPGCDYGIVHMIFGNEAIKSQNSHLIESEGKPASKEISRPVSEKIN